VRVSIGCVPIVWNNVDLPDLGPPVPYEVVLAELARLGFEGTQFGRGFPEGAELREALAQRPVRLAEVYVSLPVTDTGLGSGAWDVMRDGLDRLLAAGGEVLCVAVDGSAERDALAARIDESAPRWPDAAFTELASLLDRAADSAPKDVRVVFHPHVASWVEAPGEVDALAKRLHGTSAGLCLDVGHYLVGGGDPVEAIRRHGPLIRHVHAKDVDPAVLARMRSGELSGMWPAIRERIFTELGNGALDLHGVVEALDGIGYDGWIMVEQDSSWLPPAEAAEIGGKALRAALAEIGA
jgi:inosose dehydratase